MRNALLIWEIAGEGLELYYFHNISEFDLNLLTKANGKMINGEEAGCESEELEKVNDLLTTEEWQSNKVDSPLYAEEGYSITHVFHCGFII